MYKIILGYCFAFLVLVFLVEYPRWKRERRKANRKKNKI